MRTLFGILNYVKVVFYAKSLNNVVCFFFVINETVIIRNCVFSSWLNINSIKSTFAQMTV